MVLQHGRHAQPSGGRVWHAIGGRRVRASRSAQRGVGGRMEARLGMSGAVYSGEDVRPGAAQSRWMALDIATFAFFVIATLAIWTQVSPFIDLQDPTALDDTT